MKRFARKTKSELGNFALTGLAAILLIMMVSLFAIVGERIRGNEVAQDDQLAWRAAQVEVEYLKSRLILQSALASESPALDEVRIRLAILYSRLPLLSDQPLTHEAKMSLQKLQGVLDRYTPVIDGPDDNLISELQGIDNVLRENSALGRTIALGAIEEATTSRRKERDQIVLLLEVMTVLIAMGAAAMVATIFFLQKRSTSFRRATTYAEEKSRQLQATLDGALGGIVVSDSSGCIVDFNAGSEDVFGIRREDALGMNMSMLFPEPERSTVRKSISNFNESGRKTFSDKGVHDIRLLYADGSIFPAQVQITTAQLSSGTIFISFFRDMTHEKSHEAELTNARDEAIKAAQERSRFFAMMSHEMRTPLNGVLSSLYLIEESSLTDEQRQNLNTALYSGEILLSHINDVLTIERSENDQGLDQSVCDISAVSSNMMHMMEEMSKDFNVSLHMFQKNVEGRFFSTSPRAVQQILINLLSNAIKFSPNGSVTLSIEYIPHVDPLNHGTARFEIFDTGIGISDEDRERVFDDFVSLDSRYERRTEGTGLGLGIVRRLVQQLGGQVWCESILGEGSTFTVELPMQEASSALIIEESKNSLKCARDCKAKRILVVDDNKINLQLMEKMLTLSGHVVSIAEGGEVGVSSAFQQGFDLILMDISMPGISGTQAARAIRAKNGPNQQTPIVAFTAHALPREQEAFREAGMSGFLLKPVDRKALLACINADYCGDHRVDSDVTPAQEDDILDYKQVSQLQELLDPSELANYIGEFKLEARKIMNEMKEASADGNRYELKSSAHALAGASGMIGAIDFRIILNDIENSCENESLETIGEMMEKIDLQYHKLCDLWDRALAGH